MKILWEGIYANAMGIESCIIWHQSKISQFLPTVLAESTFSVDYIMSHQTTRIMQQYGYCVTSLSSQAIQYDREAKVRLLQAWVHHAWLFIAAGVTTPVSSFLLFHNYTTVRSFMISPSPLLCNPSHMSCLLLWQSFLINFYGGCMKVRTYKVIYHFEHVNCVGLGSRFFCFDREELPI